MAGIEDNLRFACGSVIPGCDAVFVGSTEDEILEQVGPHARDDHGVEEITPELVDKVRSHIQRPS